MAQVSLVEVGPRDGLQNEPTFIPTAEKIALVDALTEAGLKRIEVSSFVSPKWVPQLADAAKVFAGIQRKAGTRYAALVPNVRGCDAAAAAGADEVAIFASASETFSQKNINCSVSESLERFKPVVQLAAAHSLPIRGYVSCVTDCPYEGRVNPAAVGWLAESLVKLGCYEVSLGDTIGQGEPQTVGAMLDAVLPAVPAAQLAGHFHDTSGQALTNIAVCLERGLSVFDTSIGGLGGCPYAPGASGNVATETVAAWLVEQGIEVDLDIARLKQTARDFARSSAQFP